MKEKQTEEIISLNDETFQDFSVEELELRLETDPLFLSNLLQLGEDGNNDASLVCKQCQAGGYENDCKCKGVDIDIFQ